MKDTVSDHTALTPSNHHECYGSPNDISDGHNESLREPTPNNHEELERLKSFPRTWSLTLKKPELAAKGFYFISSMIKCYCCGLQISTERICSRLFALHLEHTPSCNFAHGRETTPKNVPLQNTSDYRYEINRYISFLSADWYPEVDPEDLAKWGFYWTGTADVGRCNFCRLEVRGWEPTDRGQSEHMRWNPHCPFMQNRAVGNVRIGEEAMASIVADDATRSRSVFNIRAHNTRIAEECGIMLTAPPRHPEYASESSRFGSYSMWPLSMHQRPEQLSEAGFYYTSKGDRVICFQCGGGLKDWGQMDVPWVEHAVWFPRCAFLVLKKDETLLLMF